MWGCECAPRAVFDGQLQFGSCECPGIILRAIRGCGAPGVGRFDDIYAVAGAAVDFNRRPLRALLLQVLYTVRSERLLMEHLDYDVLLRWFVGLSIDDQV